MAFILSILVSFLLAQGARYSTLHVIFCRRAAPTCRDAHLALALLRFVSCRLFPTSIRYYIDTRKTKERRGRYNNQPISKGTKSSQSQKSRIVHRVSQEKGQCRSCVTKPSGQFANADKSTARMLIVLGTQRIPSVACYFEGINVRPEGYAGEDGWWGYAGPWRVATLASAQGESTQAEVSRQTAGETQGKRV